MKSWPMLSAADCLVVGTCVVVQSGECYSAFSTVRLIGLDA